jgi:regulatory protein
MTPYPKALDLLAARPHFRRQLQDKLAKRGFPEEEIEAALDRLEAEGYLKDARTARDFLAHRRERVAEGPARLRMELLKRGCPPEVAEEALAGLPEEDDLEAAQEAARRWRARGRQDPAALARHLARKGFSPRAIVTVLKEEPGGDLLQSEDGIDP